MVVVYIVHARIQEFISYLIEFTSASALSHSWSHCHSAVTLCTFVCCLCAAYVRTHTSQFLYTFSHTNRIDNRMLNIFYLVFFIYEVFVNA
jgi:hypothetical protein